MHCCARGDRAANAVSAPPTTRRSWLRRIAALVQWALPITTLALIPKCPACFAAYIMLFTGLGLSFSAADTLRTILIILSIALIAYLCIQAVRHLFFRTSRSGPAHA